MSKQKISELQTERAKFKPVLPSIIKNDPAKVITKFGTPTKSVSDYETVQKLFPNTYGMPTVNFIKGKKSEVAKKIIKVDKLFTLEKSVVIKKLGKLNQSSFEDVKKEFLSLI